MKKIDRIPNCKCLNCGKEFFKLPSVIKAGEGKYCSRQCADAMHSKKYQETWVVSKCEICGKEIKHPNFKSPKYCSYECKHIGHGNLLRKREIKTCENCGKEFMPTSAKGKFCSPECVHENQNRKVLVKCVICGKEVERKRCHSKTDSCCSKECLSTLVARRFIGHTHNKGRKQSDELKKWRSEDMKKRFQDPEFQKQWAKSMANSPNKLEQDFDALTPNNVVFKGNGKFFLTFKNGQVKNPDFVVEHQRKVIELYGDYWHKGDIPQELIDLYAEIGFEAMVIWESQFRNNTEEVLTQVNNFIQP